MTFFLAASKSTTDSFQIFAEIAGAVMALLSLAWTVTRDWRKNAENKDHEEEVQHTSYVQVSLDAFQDVVKSLQLELDRLRVERTRDQQRFEKIEGSLSIEITDLRLDIQSLIGALRQQGMPIPLLHRELKGI